jgi:Flp pilus assembly pilin Flp
MKNVMKNLWNDESGQGATEYILLLVVIVGLAMMFRTKLTAMVSEKLSDLSSSMSSFQVNSGN